MHGVRALGLGPGDANDTATGEACKLSNYAADGTGSGSDDDCLACLWPSDHVQAVPRGLPGHAEDTDSSTDWRQARVDNADGSRIEDGELLPTAPAGHDASDGNRRVIGYDHFANRAPGHDGVEWGWSGVRLPVVHASPHVGIERQEVCPNEQFARSGMGHWSLDDREVFWLGQSVWASAELDLPVHCGHFISSFQCIVRSEVDSAWLRYRVYTPGN